MVSPGDPPLPMPLIKVQGPQDTAGPEERPAPHTTALLSVDRQPQKNNLPKAFQHVTLNFCVDSVSSHKCSGLVDSPLSFRYFKFARCIRLYPKEILRGRLVLCD